MLQRYLYNQTIYRKNLYKVSSCLYRRTRAIKTNQDLKQMCSLSPTQFNIDCLRIDAIIDIKDKKIGI